MKTVKLLSWHDDISQKAAMLKRRGLQIDSTPLVSTSGAIGELARLSPSVLVLDLDRLPSHSRVIATVLRTSKSARHIPILFAGGQQEKISRIRTELPDASFTSWSEAPQALAELLLHPPSPPSITRAHPVFTTPLAQKLGIRADMHLSLIAAPDSFEECLGDLPENTSLATRLTPKTGLALCFVRSLTDLNATLDLLTLRLPKKASVWIVHPNEPVNIKSISTRTMSATARSQLASWITRSVPSITIGPRSNLLGANASHCHILPYPQKN